MIRNLVCFGFQGVELEDEEAELLHVYVAHYVVNAVLRVVHGLLDLLYSVLLLEVQDLRLAVFRPAHVQHEAVLRARRSGWRPAWGS